MVITRRPQFSNLLELMFITMGGHKSLSHIFIYGIKVGLSLYKVGIGGYTLQILIL